MDAAPSFSKWREIHLNVIYIIELLLFSVINIFVFVVFKYNLSEDISSDVSVYLSDCGLIVETASDSVCVQFFYLISVRYCSLAKHALYFSTELASLSINI